MKILLLKSLVDINDLKELKLNNIITYNANDPNIDIVINDRTIYFQNFKHYSIEYTHWMENVNLPFIVGALEETLTELSSMNF